MEQRISVVLCLALAAASCLAQPAADPRQSQRIEPQSQESKPSEPVQPIPNAQTPDPKGPSQTGESPQAISNAPANGAPDLRPVDGVPNTGATTGLSNGTSSGKKVYTVPAGTKVLLQLRAAVNTKSAHPGDGVYLASTFPVVVGSRVMIPAGVYVQGIVDTVVRPGRVKGRAQLNLHFSSIIFPNGTVVEIPGIINSLPGSTNRTVDEEGKVEEKSNKGRDVANAAKIGLEGAGIGTIAGAASGHPLEGLAAGGIGGAAVGAVVALFTRGDDINIENGTPVEMVLQRPLLLEESNLATTNENANAYPGFVPAGGQQRPLGKPIAPKAHVICPAGGLGCN